MLRLGLASSIPEIQEALSDPETGLYDVNRHMYLRRNYVVVYVGPESRSIDTHKHYVEGGGYTEHTEFIDKLQTPEELEPIARGPKSTGKRPKHVKPKSKARLETLDLRRTPLKSSDGNSNKGKCCKHACKSNAARC